MKTDMIFKSFKVTLKDLDIKKVKEGNVTVAFASMGVVDKDGDVAVPGFYGKQTIAFLPTHDWSHVPLGKGVTREEGDLAIADIKMNLDIQAAKDWLSAIVFDMENGVPIQEYSYGFKVLDGGSRRGDYDGRQVRYLTPREDGTPGSKIWEVSPVLVGAGEGTHTMMAKTAKDAGAKFAQECQEVLDAAEALTERSGVLAALRAKDGREISAANKERLAALAASMVKCAGDVSALVAPEVKEPSAAEAAAKKELARMLRVRAGI